MEEKIMKDRNEEFEEFFRENIPNQVEQKL